MSGKRQQIEKKFQKSKHITKKNSPVIRLNNRIDRVKHQAQTRSVLKLKKKKMSFQIDSNVYQNQWEKNLHVE